MSTVDPFHELMNIAADPAWRGRIGEIASEYAVPGVQELDPAIYLAAFSTPAGRAVLADLYNRYVNVSRFVPGEPDGSGYYREGAAQVVFDIAAKLEAAAQGEEDGQGTDEEA